MSDADDVRRLALALSGVEEIPSDGFDFRAGGKGFIWSYPDRQGGRRVLRTDIAVLYVGDEAEKVADFVAKYSGKASLGGAPEPGREDPEGTQGEGQSSP